VIAYTWDHFLRDPSQPEWLVRFPMVKASVRAMDAMKEFCQYKFPELGTSLDYFGVSGASKRGWTTWLVGAVDANRVKLIIPVVLDAINFVAVEHHEYQSYGGWSWALTDYTDMDIMSRMDEPNMLLLQQMEDPYFYRDRLTMPKLVVNAVLDEFQQPDDTRYWWNDMPGPKHFIMTPNAGNMSVVITSFLRKAVHAEHSEITGILEVCPDIIAYAQYLVHDETIPSFTWDIRYESHRL
jgi:PhoPQ-activated pathogenicity-related protein